jgi:hypothetical protein
MVSENYLARFLIYIFLHLLLVLVGLVKGVQPHVAHGDHGIGVVGSCWRVQNSLEFFLQQKCQN